MASAPLRPATDQHAAASTTVGTIASASRPQALMDSAAQELLVALFQIAIPAPTALKEKCALLELAVEGMSVWDLRDVRMV